MGVFFWVLLRTHRFLFDCAMAIRKFKPLRWRFFRAGSQSLGLRAFLFRDKAFSSSPCRRRFLRGRMTAVPKTFVDTFVDISLWTIIAFDISIPKTSVDIIMDKRNALFGPCVLLSRRNPCNCNVPRYEALFFDLSDFF